MMIEIHPINSLNKEILIPGSKYLANRAIILAALALGKSTLTNVPINEDIKACLNAMEQLGAQVAHKNGSIEIKGFNGRPIAGQTVDVGESGTLLRLILAVTSLANGTTLITGSGKLPDRPITALTNSFNDLGIFFERPTEKTVPLKIIGGTLQGGTTDIAGHISSQFISALLLAAPFAKTDVEINIETPLISKSFVDMTIDLMKQFGVEVTRNGYDSFHIKSGQHYKSQQFNLPSDWVSGSYFLAAKILFPGSLTINTSSLNETSQFQSILNQIRDKTDSIEIDMSDMPDVVQTAAIVAAFSKGKTRFTNIAHLQHKESDRLAGTAKLLREIGIEAQSGDDYLEIIGGSPKKTTIDPMNDHRNAMSFAIIGLKVGMRIINPDCVNKSFPGFWNTLKALGAKVERL